MARLSFAALALFAVAAVVAAGPSPAKGGANAVQARHGFRSWLQNKEAQFKSWSSREIQQLKSQWKSKLVPIIKNLQQKFGAEWQKDAPKIAAFLKKQAGVFFDKAVQYVGTVIQSQG